MDAVELTDACPSGDCCCSLSGLIGVGGVIDGGDAVDDDAAADIKDGGDAKADKVVDDEWEEDDADDADDDDEEDDDCDEDGDDDEDTFDIMFVDVLAAALHEATASVWAALGMELSRRILRSLLAVAVVGNDSCSNRIGDVAIAAANDFENGHEYNVSVNSLIILWLWFKVKLI